MCTALRRARQKEVATINVSFPNLLISPSLTSFFASSLLLNFRKTFWWQFKVALLSVSLEHEQSTETKTSTCLLDQ